MMTAVFAIVLIVVLGGIALALAGRWNPQGLDELSRESSVEGRFDVVLRGYQMDQVDAEIARLQGLIAASEADPQEVPRVPDQETLES